jgi:hypothetical protein
MTKEEIKHIGRFTKKFLILLLVLFVCDRVIGTLIEKAYNDAPEGDVNTFSHSINNPKEDIYIYGSSRAVHGYDCKVFTDSLGYSCFNNGRENSTILYHNTILNEMLKKHEPQIVILDVSAKELTWRSAENSKLVLASMILPYVRRDTNFRNIAKELFPEELRKAEVSKIYAYNSLILPLLLGPEKADKSNIVNGYLPLHGVKEEGTPPELMDENDKTDVMATQDFENFVKVLTEKHIKLYVIQSPLYVKPFSTSVSLEAMKAILKKYNVPFWDYAFDTAFYKRQYFYDNIHLNDKGAKLFSARIASDIKKDLEKDKALPVQQKSLANR